MARQNARTVYHRSDGTWANKRNGATRASRVYTSQREAIDGARRMLRAEGGGELTVMGEDGAIRSKDTIPPGHDPYPPKDQKH